MDSKNKRKSVEEKSQQEPTSNIWQDIIKEAMTNKELSQSHIFVFGEKNSGKRTLFRNINRNILGRTEFEEMNLNKKNFNLEENSSKYSVVDYTYLPIKRLNDSEGETLGKIGVWIFNDFIKKEIFETAIRTNYILNSICVLVVDLSKPWDLIKNLREWTKYIYETLGSLMTKLPLDKQEALKQKIINYIKLWEDELFEKDKKDTPEMAEKTRLKLSMELSEGVLKTNLGIPIVIVVNKSNIVTSGGEKKRFEEDSEFILKHLRNFSLSIGATLIYASPKQNLNLNIIYDYFLHRLFNFDFTHKFNVSDKELYFIPSGYDSKETLKLFDSNNELSKLYEERIVVGKQKLLPKEEEIVCVDLQVFLSNFKPKASIMKVPSVIIRHDESELREKREADQKENDSPMRRQPSVVIGGSSSKKVDIKEVQVTEYATEKIGGTSISPTKKPTIDDNRSAEPKQGKMAKSDLSRKIMALKNRKNKEKEEGNK